MKGKSMSRNDRTRVLFTNHTGEVSGAERVLLQMLRGLDRQMYEPTVLCAENGPLRAEVEMAGVRCLSMPTVQARFTRNPRLLLGYLGSLVHAIRVMRKQIQAAAPDLLHANTVRAGIITTVASIGTGIPVVWHVHDILPSHPISTAIRWLVWSSRRTRAFAVSDATGKAFVANASFGDRVATLYNGVDLRRFPAKATGSGPRDRLSHEVGKEHTALCLELGLPESAFLFCQIGQIAPRKGLRELVTAFAELAAANADTHLLIVGEAIFNKDYEYRDEVLALRDQLGLQLRVHFLGARRDVPRIMRGIDVLVLNSLQEPFGLVLVEAVSSGTAVLAANVGGIPEIVTDGETGWLVDPKNAASLAARMLHLITHREEMEAVQREAMQTICPRFSENRFLLELHTLYAALPFRRREKSNLPANPSWQAGVPGLALTAGDSEGTGA